ncbi:MAG TPA: aminotransferase class I/II-fold pyridoxal phosphate-dependent enzyme [Methylomirabilota bacterium]|nr:aminotransferase class I/II-fold pyridoxal phosphate-dependent enzyme [Methylomirabilota bacterium]
MNASISAQGEKLALLGGSPVRTSLLPYARQTIEADDVAAVSEALTSDWITQGPVVARFEEALAAFGGVAHAVVFSSGTAALHAACWAAQIGPGDDVITTPLTFAATANAIVSQGARPVFADIDPRSLNVDPEAVMRKATARTRAILPVDFAGLPCDYDWLLSLARDRGWIVIADAAHSLGGAYRDRPVGAIADMTVFSFHPAKSITCGEGGAVLTDRADLAERLRRVRHHGIRYLDPQRPWRYEIEQPGQNYRLTDFQSALGLSQLKKLEVFWMARSRLARRYRELLSGARFLELPALPQGVRHAWHLFVVLLRSERLSADQDLILQTLRAENIGVQLHYSLIYHHPFYRKRFGYEPGLCPLAESVERRLMTLPLFASMSEADQDDVLRALEKVFAHYARC